MKSIMHDKSKHFCFLCAILHDDYSEKMHLQEHHCIHGTASRKLSEQYGLKIYLCDKHHTYDQGPEAVHRNADIDLIVKKAAEYAFMLNYPEMDFKSVFGKHFLNENEIPKRISEKTGKFEMIEVDDVNDFDALGDLFNL